MAASKSVALRLSPPATGATVGDADAQRFKRRNRKADRPIPDRLPAYIHERDHLAVDAGLIVERAWGGYASEELVSIYRGSYAALIASPFITDKAHLRLPKSPRHCIKTGVTAPWSAGRRTLVGAFAAEDGTCYVKFQEMLPEKWGRLENGTEYFLFGGYRDCAIYRGSRAALIQDAVVVESTFPTEDEVEVELDESVAGSTYTVCTVRHLDACFFEVIRDLHAERELERLRAEHIEKARAPLFSDAETYRQKQIKFFRSAGDLLIEDMRGQPGRTLEYRFDEESVQEVTDLLAELEETLQGSGVHCKAHINSKAAGDTSSRHAAAEAATDRPFQAFLRSLRREEP